MACAQIKVKYHLTDLAVRCLSSGELLGTRED